MRWGGYLVASTIVAIISLDNDNDEVEMPLFFFKLLSIEVNTL